MTNQRTPVRLLVQDQIKPLGSSRSQKCFFFSLNLSWFLVPSLLALQSSASCCVLLRHMKNQAAGRRQTWSRCWA